MGGGGGGGGRGAAGVLLLQQNSFVCTQHWYTVNPDAHVYTSHISLRKNKRANVHSLSLELKRVKF